jgi:hypothetical protein
MSERLTQSTSKMKMLEQEYLVNTIILPLLSLTRFPSLSRILSFRFVNSNTNDRLSDTDIPLFVVCADKAPHRVFRRTVNEWTVDTITFNWGEKPSPWGTSEGPGYPSAITFHENRL